MELQNDLQLMHSAAVQVCKARQTVLHQQQCSIQLGIFSAVYHCAVSWTQAELMPRLRTRLLLDISC